MDFEEALRAELSSISSLSGRIFPVNRPEKVSPPCLIYLSSEGVAWKSLEGYLDTREVECELNILSLAYSGLKPLTQAVIEKIKTFQSRSIGTDGPYIQNISYDNPVDLYEEELRWFRCNIRLTVHY